MNEVEIKQIPGVILSEYSNFTDARGETTVHRAPENQSINFSSHLISLNSKSGTVRGFHFQMMPKGEDKYVWCSQGEVLDILIDLRSGTASDCNWGRVSLNAEDRKFLFIPKGVAHGYQTQADNTIVNYLICGTYDPEIAVRINPRLSSLKDKWPLEISAIDTSDENGVSIQEALLLWRNSNKNYEG
jgi:dTDP-4-dehydrorhamnose 3,5-epimerase